MCTVGQEFVPLALLFPYNLRQPYVACGRTLEGVHGYLKSLLELWS